MARRKPTERELDVLKILWKRKRATVREVYEELRSAGEDLAYTTVLSLLQTMEERKRLVGREAKGKAHVYFARVQRDSTLRRLAWGFLQRVFDGVLGQYVVQALEARRPSVAELEELEQMIGEAKRQAQQQADRGDTS
jgi:predicted transcriptional regulator